MPAKTTAAPADDVLWGDANCDSAVDVSDCVLISRFAVEDSGAALTDKGRKAADVTHDGYVRSDDATLILRYIAKQITAAELANQ